MSAGHATTSHRGYMVVCDGSNGAGKTTLIDRLRNHLLNQGTEVVVTREPGGTPIGEKIREILLNPDTPEMCALTELMLFGAARAQHLREKILPALQAGKVVLCDRFDSSTIAFQQYARGLDRALVERINALALGDFKPDLYLILDLDPVAGLQRVKQRGADLDRMEAEQLAFLQRAREGFLQQAQADPQRFKVLDAANSPHWVAAAAISALDTLMANTPPSLLRGCEAAKQ